MKLKIDYKIILLILAGMMLVGQTVNLRARYINNVRYCDQFPGANAGVKIAACMADIPAAGGIADARGFVGTSNVISVDMFVGITAPIKLIFGAATFTMTAQQNIAADRVYIEGVGVRGTTILFAPTGNNQTAFKFANGGNIVIQGGIKDITIRSNDNTYVKTALNVVDVIDFLIEDIEIGGSVAHTGTSYWSDPTFSSIAFQAQGRDSTIVRRYWFTADKPIVIAQNPNSSLSMDHWHFEDGDTIAYLNPNITINTGVNITNVKFDGYQSMNRGNSGVTWVDTTSVGQSENLEFHSLRWEQPQSIAGYIIDIQHNTRLRNLIIDGARWGNNLAGLNGIRLRKVAGISIRNMLFDDIGTVFDLDSSNYYLNFENVLIANPAAVVTLTGVLGINGCYYLEGNGIMRCFSPNTPNVAGGVTQAFNPSTTLGVSQFEPIPVSVPNATVIKLASNEFSGIVILNSLTAGYSCIFRTTGVSNTTAVIVNDGGGCGAAAAASHFNVYSSGGEYKLQNFDLATENVMLTFIGRGEH